MSFKLGSAQHAVLAAENGPMALLAHRGLAATEQRLREIAAEALTQVYFPYSGRRAGSLEEVRFTDIEHLV